MGFLTQEIVKEMVVEVEIFRPFHTEIRQHIFRQGKDFRCQEGNGVGITNQEHFCSGSHTLIESICAVFMHTHVGIGINLIQNQRQFLILFQACQKCGCAFTQMTAVSSQFWNFFHEHGISFFPEGIIFIIVFDVPFICGGNITPLW